MIALEGNSLDYYTPPPPQIVPPKYPLAIMKRLLLKIACENTQLVLHSLRSSNLLKFNNKISFPKYFLIG